MNQLCHPGIIYNKYNKHTRQYELKLSITILFPYTQNTYLNIM